MAKILVIEDDALLAKGLVFGLDASGHNTRWNATIDGARRAMRELTPDLIILDKSLPDGDGLDFCAEARAAWPTLSIIILTAESDERAVVEAFERGADDYVRKPYSMAELKARVAYHTRDLVLDAGDVIDFHGIVLRRSEMSVAFEGQSTRLRRTEFELLLYFAQRPGVIVTRERLLDVLGRGEEISDRTIDAHICALRKLIKQNRWPGLAINTVYGAGYRLG